MSDSQGRQGGLVQEVGRLRTRIRQLEQSLRRQDREDPHQLAQSRTPYSNCPLPYQALDKDGCILEINPAWLQVLGYDRHEVVGHWFGEFLTDDNRALFQERFLALKTAGKMVDDQFELVRREGTHLTVESNGTVEFDPQGRFLAIYCILKDITERKRVEEKLRESEERYGRLAATITDAIMFFDEETRRVVHVNKASEHLYGYSREEFLELRLSDISAEPDESAKAISHIINGDITGVPVRYHKKKDGTVFPVEISASTFVLGGRRVVCDVNRDITERKQAEEKLQKSEKEFRALFEQAGDYILLLEVTEDKDLVIADVNRAACEIHGYTREELLGMSIKNLDRGLDDEQVQALLNRMVSGESILFETVRAKKDGTIFPVEVSGKLLDTEGNKTLIISLERNITKRKQTEKALRESKARYKALFENMQNGFALHEMVFDEEGKPIDYIFLRYSQKLWIDK